MRHTSNDTRSETNPFSEPQATEYMQLWPEITPQNMSINDTMYYNQDPSEIQLLDPNPCLLDTVTAPLYDTLTQAQHFGMAGPSAGNSQVAIQLQPGLWDMPTSVGFAQALRLPKQGFTPEQDTLLLALPREGREYSHIAEQMRLKFGMDTTENRLVKRFQTIQDRYFDPLPVAVKNAMPDIIASIKSQMSVMPELAQLAANEQELLEQIIHELPRSIPKFVQNKVTSKRKAMLHTSTRRI